MRLSPQHAITEIKGHNAGVVCPDCANAHTLSLDTNVKGPGQTSYDHYKCKCGAEFSIGFEVVYWFERHTAKPAPTDFQGARAAYIRERHTAPTDCTCERDHDSHCPIHGMTRPGM